MLLPAWKNEIFDLHKVPKEAPELSGHDWAMNGHTLDMWGAALTEYYTDSWEASLGGGTPTASCSGSLFTRWKFPGHLQQASVLDTPCHTWAGVAKKQ